MDWKCQKYSWGWGWAVRRAEPGRERALRLGGWVGSGRQSSWDSEARLWKDIDGRGNGESCRLWDRDIT